MVNKTNLSAFAYMTNKKFTCITVTSHNFNFDQIHKFLCDSVLAISKSLLDVSFIAEINLYLKDCFGSSYLIFGNNQLGFLKL